MSVRSQVIAAFAEGTRRAPATWERITGNLGHAGYTPKGRPGGGIGAAHYGVDALASVLMASSAVNPSDAAQAVAKLEELRAAPPATPLTDHFLSSYRSAVPPKTTLRKYLEQEIVLWSAPSAEMLDTLANDRFHLPLWKLELSPDFPSAILSMHKKDSGWYSTMFFPEQFTDTAAQSGFSVSTTLPLSLIKTAGDLLRDTLVRHTPASSSLLDPSDGDPDENGTPGRVPSRRPGKRAQPMNDPARIVGTLTPTRRERQHVLLGLPHTGAPPFERTRHENALETAFG